MIEANLISKRIGRKFIFKDLSFSLEEGEILWIKGKNGAGKTTLLECIAGIQKHSSGELSIFGESKATLDSQRNLFKNVGLCLHDSFLYGDLSLQENFNFFSQLYKVSKEDLEELVRYFDLSHILDVALRNCSRGEVKRASLLRAFLAKPKLLILDEPFESLDKVNKQSLSNLIERKISENSNMSVIFTSHEDSNMLEKTKLKLKILSI